MNFSPIAAGFRDFAAPQGTAADMGSFFNDWNTKSFAFDDAFQRKQANAYNASRNQEAIEDAGLKRLLGQTEDTTALMRQGNQQFQQQVTAFVNTCAANGWSTPECRDFARANNIQIPQQQALTGSTFTGADYSMNSPAYSGLGLR
jgi:hypothetical protein